jgi:hypothetical protein
MLSDITKSEIGWQANSQGEISREKVKSGGTKEIAVDSGCFRQV